MLQNARPSTPDVPDAETLAPLAFRRAMRGLAGGVSVVTAGLGAERTGATVTSAHSLSVEPETMVVSIALSSSTWRAIRLYGHFCVNILRADQQPVAERFSGFGGVTGAARYEGARWRALVTGASALEGAIANVDCEVEEVFERHSHAIVLGRIMALASAPGPGLLYADGRYHEMPPAARAEPEGLAREREPIHHRPQAAQGDDR